MNALNVLFIVAGIIYGLLVDATFWKIYFTLVAIYFIVVVLTRNQIENTKRKNIMISTWSGKCEHILPQPYSTFICAEPTDPTAFVTN